MRPPPLLVSLLLLAACAPAADKADDTGDPGGAPACWTDLAPGEAVAVAEGLTDGTEGVAFVDGRLFVSVDDGVVEIGPDGTTTPLATTGAALGLAPAEGGLLVADPGEFTLDGSGDDGRVLFVGLDGSVTELATGLPNPNFVATAPWGEVLVSDDTHDTLWAVGKGGARVWVEGVTSPNGLGFSPEGDRLFAVSTFTSEPPLWVVPVDAGGAPGAPSAWVDLPAGSAPDGLAVDGDGGVLVALNLAGELARVDPDGGLTTLASDLPTPASLAFGEGADWDPCSVYVTSLFGSEVWRVATGRTGVPLTRMAAPG